jgi:outer membrane protein OmpA-like peptidoglycan-associated protein
MGQMAVDWLADVRIYDAGADESVVSKIVSYCGIALQSRDGQLVAMADPKECETVRENFLKKKLGLTQSDAVLDEAIQSVREVMKADRTKNRVTVYYLLTKHFGSLNMFGGVAGAAAGAAGLAAAAAGAFSGDDDKDEGGSVAPLAAAAGIAGAGVAAVAGAASSAGAAVTGAASGAADFAADTASSAAGAVSGAVAAPLAAVRSGFDDDGAASGGFGWLKWLLLAALLAALLFFLLRSCSGQEATPVAEPDAATVDAGAAAKTEAEPVVAAATPAAVPTGSGVVAGERNGKPMLTVYFETAKTNLPTDFDKVAAVIKDYTTKNPGAKLAVSGFNSPTGSAAGNERLSKGRADNVSAALQKLGVAAGAVELVKPAAATQGTGEDANARRVEVTVQ